jgi:ferredoxin
MKLAIDDQKCQGHGRCSLINLDLFDVEVDGRGVVLIEEPDPSVEGDINKAISSCPEQAISYS